MVWRSLAFVAAVLAVPAAAAPVLQIVVHKARRELVLYENSQPVLTFTNIKLGDAPTGHKQFEGDEKTPEGRYFISGRNAASRYFLSLRISYPNAADVAYARQHAKRPGGDIFIHGQPNRSPMERLAWDWTDGCIALSNSEIEQLWKRVPNGTVVIIQP